jgi:hypothetical protein
MVGGGMVGAGTVACTPELSPSPAPSVVVPVPSLSAAASAPPAPAASRSWREASGPSCHAKGYAAPAGAKLELAARQRPGGGAVIEIELRNAGSEPACVWSHVETHELQHDWLSLQYADGGKYHHANRAVRFTDARDESAVISVLVHPGERITQRWDVGSWALRKVNGAEALSSGSLWALAVYDTSKETEVWAGRLQAQFELIAP